VLKTSKRYIHHTYKSLRFFRYVIPEGIGPLKPLPCITLSKFKVILEKIDDLEFHKKKEKVHTSFQDLSNSE
jgi:hypothetical protein